MPISTAQISQTVTAGANIASANTYELACGSNRSMPVLVHNEIIT